MNRAFKIQFHAGYPDEKTIVTMGVAVNNGKRFHALDKTNRKHLVGHLTTFIKQVEAFREEIKNGEYHSKKQ